jgi:GT2 family glycosyltransferase
VSDLAILVPVLNRPQRVAPLLDSIEAATPRARVFFLGQLYDTAENQAIQREFKRRDSDDGLRICQNLEGGTYAEKINRGCRHPKVREPLIFLGADDLEFQPGWFEAAADRLGNGVEVVGINDLIPRRRSRRGHATHFLMSRSYAELPTIDGGEGPLHTGYFHWCVDDELIATATARGAYVYAPEARIKHLHPMTGEVADDATYRKGRSRARQDRQLFRSREALWP